MGVHFNMNNHLTVWQVCQRLRCHPNTLKRWEKRLNLKVKRDYRNYRIYTEDIIKQLESYITQEK